MFPLSPAALIDALAGCLYLIKLGFSEENIIVGDSAGGNSALALTRHFLSTARSIMHQYFPTRTTSFKGFPRTFIDNGRFETFYDQIHRLGEAMGEDLGAENCHVQRGRWGHLTIDWCDPDRTETSKKILKWLGL